MARCAPSPTLRIGNSSVSICSICSRGFATKSARLRGIASCTHFTELCAVLPTVAIQAFAGEVWKVESGSPFSNAGTAPEAQPPFQLGRCHALRFDGPAVREYYPRWVDYVPRINEMTRVTPGVRRSAFKQESTKTAVHTPRSSLQLSD